MTDASVVSLIVFEMLRPTYRTWYGGLLATSLPGQRTYKLESAEHPDVLAGHSVSIGSGKSHPSSR